MVAQKGKTNTQLLQTKRREVRKKLIQNDTTCLTALISTEAILNSIGERRKYYVIWSNSFAVIKNLQKHEVDRHIVKEFNKTCYCLCKGE